MIDKQQRPPQRPTPRGGQGVPPPERITPRPALPVPPSAVEHGASEPPLPPAAPPSNPPERKAVFTVIEGSGRQARWVRVGIAFVNRDASLNVVLDAVPVNGTLHIRDFPPRDASAGEE